MKIKEIKLNKFKRFTDLTITDIPDSAKLVILVGPNGCGKTSVLLRRFYASVLSLQEQFRLLQCGFR